MAGALGAGARDFARNKKSSEALLFDAGGAAYGIFESRGRIPAFRRTPISAADRRDRGIPPRPPSHNANSRRPARGAL